MEQEYKVKISISGQVIEQGYDLMNKDQLKNAADFFEQLLGDDISKVNILLTGYHKGLDGDWHSYDDSNHGCGGSGTNGDNEGGCCEGCFCVACGITCISGGACCKPFDWGEICDSILGCIGDCICGCF